MVESFCYPIRDLENDRLRLERFDILHHAQSFWDAISSEQDVWKHLPQPPAGDLDEWIATFYLPRIARSEFSFLYAVIAKLSEEEGRMADEMAGIIGFLNTEPHNAATEIGFVVIIPKHQRSFVATNAVGLLLMYALDPPSHGGLGLRRVQWQANSTNDASVRLATRMQFTFEGIARWQRKLEPCKTGNGVDLTVLEERNERGVERPGRHSAILSMCWDDWMEKRDQVVRLMSRRN